MTNFATPKLDIKNGYVFITDVQTKKPLYRLPNCPVCGSGRWSAKPEVFECCVPDAKVEEMFG